MYKFLHHYQERSHSTSFLLVINIPDTLFLKRPEALNTKLAQGGPLGSSPFRSGGSGSCDGQVAVWTALTVAKGAQRESWKTTLGSQGTDSPTECIITIRIMSEGT